jgi:hypothetical protein
MVQKPTQLASGAHEITFMHLKQVLVAQDWPDWTSWWLFLLRGSQKPLSWPVGHMHESDFMCPIGQLSGLLLGRWAGWRGKFRILFRKISVTVLSNVLCLLLRVIVVMWDSFEIENIVSSK